MGACVNSSVTGTKRFQNDRQECSYEKEQGVHTGSVTQKLIKVQRKYKMSEQNIPWKIVYLLLYYHYNQIYNQCFRS